MRQDPEVISVPDQPRREPRRKRTATAWLKAGRDVRVASGHLWIYAGEIARIEGAVEDGGIVDVRTSEGRWVGRGFLNRQSTLTVRLLTHAHEEINDDFFRQRLTQAIAYRKRMVGDASAYRVIFGEGDQLPGLIVDRYETVLVLQTLALGMEVRKPTLIPHLIDLLQATAIFERNDPTVRRLEGLPVQTGWVFGEGDSVREIREGPARLLVDVARGQKTGFFLDQRENRATVAGYLDGAEVLDVFCYTGAFAVHAALAGASQVHALDSSAEAIALAQRNATLNGVSDRCSFAVANAFDALRQLVADGRRFDAVILDPPAFARTKDALPRAIGGYKEINLRALKLVRPGGLVVSCSCSYHIHAGLLQQIVASAAMDAHRSVRLVERRGQSRDHPIHPAIPETDYLTCLILEVH